MLLISMFSLETILKENFAGTFSISSKKVAATLLTHKADLLTHNADLLTHKADLLTHKADLLTHSQVQRLTTGG